MPSAFLLNSALHADAKKAPSPTTTTSADTALPTFSAHQPKSSNAYPQGPPDATFVDADLLSSVEDSRVELDDLADLFGGLEGVCAAETHSRETRQAEKEFGL